ncbi:golgi re-assembly stacking protein, putative [Plasmodium malariae]|uniref:Golgi re-assembly stacking protein, putative n=1 Tax=Plasmodium malariae TaxID=5858 RepID=A0A1D3JHA0_PLAMA|nr:golgi re-assembly stacking protein, putative [Plasmodium malariae]SBT85685.1 golgi re-assembly stacking protein, putative [Plasmodium malariae]
MGAGQAKQHNMGKRKEEKKLRYLVIKVSENSPASECNIEIFFDYIVQADNLKLLDGFRYTYDNFVEKLRQNENKELLLLVYNCRYNEMKQVKIIPRKWKGNGLLGINLSYESSNAMNEGVRVLEIFEGSPAFKSNLIEYSDYIIGQENNIFRNQDELTNYIDTNYLNYIKEKKTEPFRLYFFVYNKDTEKIRKVQIEPNNSWGCKGLLGCNIGTGFIHKIPFCKNDNFIKGLDPNNVEGPQAIHIGNSSMSSERNNDVRNDDSPTNLEQGSEVGAASKGDKVGGIAHIGDSEGEMGRTKGFLIPGKVGSIVDIEHTMNNEQTKETQISRTHISNREYSSDDNKNYKKMKTCYYVNNNYDTSKFSGNIIKKDILNNNKNDDDDNDDDNDDADDDNDDDNDDDDNDNDNDGGTANDNDGGTANDNDGGTDKNECDISNTIELAKEDLEKYSKSEDDSLSSSDKRNENGYVDDYTDYVRSMRIYSKEMNEIYESMNKNSELLNSIKMRTVQNSLDENYSTNSNKLSHTHAYTQKNDQEQFVFPYACDKEEKEKI